MPGINVGLHEQDKALIRDPFRNNAFRKSKVDNVQI